MQLGIYIQYTLSNIPFHVPGAFVLQLDMLRPHDEEKRVLNIATFGVNIKFTPYMYFVYDNLPVRFPSV